jgi:hypothetical protein
MFVVPSLLGLLPSSWSNAINPYLPSSAADTIWTIRTDAQALSTRGWFTLFCGYAVLSLAIAAALMVRRDT